MENTLEQSDGYHTFAELYDHRHSLCLALMKTMPELAWYSKRHEDGELCFGDEEWFIVGVDLPTGTITYHLPAELWSVAQKTGARELELGKQWDGHTPSDVVQRLQQFAQGPNFRTCYAPEELWEIKSCLSRAADCAWDDGRPMIGRQLDRILDKLDSLT